MVNNWSPSNYLQLERWQFISELPYLAAITEYSEVISVF